jgi:hypothetical protein
MTRLKIVSVAVLLIGSNSLSQSRPKVPHSHHSQSGGLVLMLGDDHVEVIRTKTQLFLDFSDKVRDPVKVEDLHFDVRFASDKSVVPFTVDSKNPHRAVLNLPSRDIEMMAYRKKNVPKGQILKKDFVKLDLGRVPTEKHNH